MLPLGGQEDTPVHHQNGTKNQQIATSNTSGTARPELAVPVKPIISRESPNLPRLRDFHPCATNLMLGCSITQQVAMTPVTITARQA